MKSKLLLSFCFLTLAGMIYGQTKITGQVTSAEDGSQLIGVSVSVKGTTVGTITDLSGGYSLSIPASVSAEILTFSYVGMKGIEVPIQKRSIINVVMETDPLGLDEVVVVGYGTQKRSDLTGSISSVSSKDFEDQPVTTVSQALQGRVAGVAVTTNSGAPGGNVKIRIRGANSMLGDNNPLYIVDGVAYNLGLGDINVNDIESFEVLKDASATAIYGSRGANGVILISTKKGKYESSQIQANVNIGISSIASKYNLMDAGAFAEMANVYRPNYFTADEISGFKQNGGVNWQDEAFQTGVSKDYQVSASGGSEKTKYYVSGNYLDQTGIIKRSSRNKYSARINLTSKLTERLSLDFNFFAVRLEALNTGDMGAKTNPVMSTLVYSPTFPIYTNAGIWNRSDGLASPNAPNPLMQLMERYDDFRSTTSTINTKLNYQILDGLTFAMVLGADNNSYTPGGYQNEWINAAQTTAYLSENKSFNWQNSNILSYKKLVNGNHGITVTGIVEQSQFNNSGFNARGSNVLPISVMYYNLGIASGQSIGSYKSKTSLRSYVGRFSYIFSDKYLLTATYRADGTSKFQGDNKWGYFPSVSAAWRVSEESFLKDNDAITNLKIRASWGVTGNQGVDPYATVSRIGTTYTTFGLGQSFAGSTISGVDNPNLKWETTAQTNFGVDMSFANNRVSLSADIYKKKTKDLLHMVSIPRYYGGGGVNRNIGEMENKGFEAILSAIPVDNKNFRWDLSFNVTANQNTLIDLGADSLFLGGNYSPGMTQESPFVIKVGESLGSFWGYEWMGIYSSSEAEEAAKYGFAPGDNKYFDFNDDGVIDSGDKHVIGNALPKFIWGLSSNMRFGQFGLDVFINGVHGNQVLNAAYAASSTILSDFTSITHVDGSDYWRTDNEDAMFADPTSSTGKNFIESTQFLQDGSFIKLRNISLSYNLDDTFGFGSLKFSISAQNLLTFTDYLGFDPEASTSGVSDIDGAVDVGAYPTARTITFGIQATF